MTIAGIPAGRTCLVTETPPTGGLANASFAWGTPTYSTQPVTITDQGTATVTITNTVVQNFGTFSVTKTVQNAVPDGGGYVGGTTRVFPLAYSCTLTGGPTTTGSIDLTLGQAASPATSIPTGSVCTFTETLTAQPGDFADPSYVWRGATVTPTTVTIGASTTVTLGVTNTYTRQFGSLQLTKVVDAPVGAYLGVRAPRSRSSTTAAGSSSGPARSPPVAAPRSPDSRPTPCARPGADDPCRAAGAGVCVGHPHLDAGGARHDPGRRHGHADRHQPGDPDLRPGAGDQADQR